MGAALTYYARRYALFTLVGIAGEDDLDTPDLPVTNIDRGTAGSGRTVLERRGAFPDHAKEAVGTLAFRSIELTSRNFSRDFGVPIYSTNPAPSHTVACEA